MESHECRRRSISEPSQLRGICGPLLACQGPHLKRSPSIRIKSSTARCNPPIHCHPHPLRWTPSSPWLLLSLDGQSVSFIVLLSSLSLSACTTLVQQHQPPFEARLAGRLTIASLLIVNCTILLVLQPTITAVSISQLSTAFLPPTFFAYRPYTLSSRINTLLIVQNRSNPQTKTKYCQLFAISRVEVISIHRSRRSTSLSLPTQISRSFRDTPLRSAGLCLLSD